MELGPFDILAWQLLWIVGLFLGQCDYTEKSVLRSLPGALRPVVVTFAIGFLCWRWTSIYLGWDLSNGTWLLDKWHLGPLRLINFFATGWLISHFLKRGEAGPFLFDHVTHWPSNAPSVLLPDLSFRFVDWYRRISETPFEPFTSLLVMCQLLTAFLLAWFFEWKSHGKSFAAALPPELLNNWHIPPPLHSNGLSDQNGLPKTLLVPAIDCCGPTTAPIRKLQVANLANLYVRREALTGHDERHKKSTQNMYIIYCLNAN